MAQQSRVSDVKPETNIRERERECMEGGRSDLSIIRLTGRRGQERREWGRDEEDGKREREQRQTSLLERGLIRSL